MGVHCEIKFFKPSNGAYIPGCVVSGAIKYTVEEETVFDKITLSLHGRGYVSVTDKTSRRLDRGISTHRNFEDYVNIENVIHTNEKGMALHIGSYKSSFSFQLPQDIPASLEYHNSTATHNVRSKIAYYICIKFVKAEFKKFAKNFEKEFTVVSRIKSKLSTKPMIHYEHKKLFQLFGDKNNFVNIKATIENSVIQRGGHVKFNYEIFNDTNLCVKSIETKLVEIYSVKCEKCANMEICSDVADTDAKTGAIKSGSSQKDSVIIRVPSDRISLEFSQIIARSYFVYISANVPFPHRNVVLKVPIQVGDKISAVDDVQNVTNDLPPSYWEAMGKMKEESIEKIRKF